jgi:hypothetical protein
MGMFRVNGSGGQTTGSEGGGEGGPQDGRKLSGFLFFEDIVLEAGVSGCEIVEEDFTSTYGETFDLFLSDTDF